MRSWVWTVVLLAIAVGVAVVLHDHGGNVIIVAQPWRIELSLALAVVLAVVVFIVLHAVLGVLSWLGRGPGRWRAWRGRRSQRHDIELLERGWTAILEGRYVPAERDLSRLLSHTRSAPRKVLAGLSAAQALHRLGETARRDQTLQQARDGAGNDERLRQAVDTVGAEILLDEKHPKEALALLEPYQNSSTRFLHGRRLMLRAHRQLNHAEQVYLMTRELLRRGAIDPAQGGAFIREAAAQRLEAADETAWKALWGDLTTQERLDPQVAGAAARAQQRLGHAEEAARILEASLSHELNDELLRAYARCDASQATQRLGHAELWLKTHPDHPELLATLGQLCLLAQLWGQGEHYLERSLALRRDAHIHALLGNLHAALDHTDEALRHWRLAADAADVGVPVVNRLLPAADTGGDPPFRGAALADGAGPGAGATPEAASGAYLQDDEGQPTAVTPKTPAPPRGTAAAPSDDEAYFDTAPIPGVDMSQTSDGRNAH